MKESEHNKGGRPIEHPDSPLHIYWRALQRQKRERDRKREEEKEN